MGPETVSSWNPWAWFNVSVASVSTGEAASVSETEGWLPLLRGSRAAMAVSLATGVYNNDGSECLDGRSHGRFTLSAIAADTHDLTISGQRRIQRNCCINHTAQLPRSQRRKIRLRRKKGGEWHWTNRSGLVRWLGRDAARVWAKGHAAVWRDQPLGACHSNGGMGWATVDGQAPGVQRVVLFLASLKGI